MYSIANCLRLRVAWLCLLGLCGVVMANNRDINNPNAPNAQLVIANANNATREGDFIGRRDNKIANGATENKINSAITADQKLYYTHDGLGSARTLTDGKAKIINQHDYTAFGDNHNRASIKLANEKLLTAQLANTQSPNAKSPTIKSPNEKISFHNRYAYTGREQSIFAEHNAPMYYRWRMYAPQIGRFEKRDPEIYQSNYNGNLYQYCVNAPIVYSDAYWENGLRLGKSL